MAKGNPSHIIKRERKKEKGSKSGKTGWVGGKKVSYVERKKAYVDQSISCRSWGKRYRNVKEKGCMQLD